MRKYCVILLVIVFSTAATADEQIFPNCTRNDVSENGVVNNEDLQLISDYLQGLTTLSCIQILHADINRDHRINAFDVEQLRDELLHFGQPFNRYMWGDIDGDGYFAVEDLEILLDDTARISDMPTLGYSTADINGDGRVDNDDLIVFDDCVNSRLTTPFTAMSNR